MIVGALTNAVLLYWTFDLHEDVPCDILFTAQVFIAVCGFRCVFPNRYNDNVVLHDTWLSSIWITRVLATFSETFWLYQLSVLNRDLNAIRGNGPLVWIDIASWLMAFLCCFAQCCVWSSLTFQTDILMWYEEFNWALMFILNTSVNLTFFFTGDIYGADPRWQCVWISLLFGAIYLPFQIGGHLPYIMNADRRDRHKKEKINLDFKQVKKGCLRMMTHRKPSTTSQDWGDSVGAFWMFGYWILEPVWLFLVALSYSVHLSN